MKKNNRKQFNKAITFVMQKNLYTEFEVVCKQQFKTVSEMLRHCMYNIIKENKKSEDS